VQLPDGGFTVVTGNDAHEAPGNLPNRASPMSYSSQMGQTTQMDQISIHNVPPDSNDLLAQINQVMVHAQFKDGTLLGLTSPAPSGSSSAQTRTTLQEPWGMVSTGTPTPHSVFAPTPSTSHTSNSGPLPPGTHRSPSSMSLGSNASHDSLHHDVIMPQPSSQSNPIQVDYITAVESRLPLNPQTALNQGQIGIEPRKRMTTDQVKVLRDAFSKNKKPDIATRQALANGLNLPLKRVTSWFAGQRGSLKRRATDHDSPQAFSPNTTDADADEDWDEPESPQMSLPRPLSVTIPIPSVPACNLNSLDRSTRKSYPNLAAMSLKSPSPLSRLDTATPTSPLLGNSEFYLDPNTGKVLQLVQVGSLGNRLQGSAPSSIPSPSLPMQTLQPLAQSSPSHSVQSPSFSTQQMQQDQQSQIVQFDGKAYQIVTQTGPDGRTSPVLIPITRRQAISPAGVSPSIISGPSPSAPSPTTTAPSPGLGMDTGYIVKVRADGSLEIQNTESDRKSVNPSSFSPTLPSATIQSQSLGTLSGSSSVGNLTSMNKQSMGGITITREQLAQLASSSNVIAKFPSGNSYAVGADRLTHDASGRLFVNVPEAREDNHEWMSRYTHVDDVSEAPRPVQVVPVTLNSRSAPLDQDLFQLLIRSGIVSSGGNVQNGEQDGNGSLRRSMSFPVFQQDRI